MFNFPTIEKKLHILDEYIEELRPFVSFSLEEVLQDSYKYHTAERVFQLVVDTMVDINIHILKGALMAAPDDLQSTFLALAENSILPREFAEKIAPLVGLRNRIVHRYESLQRKTFIESLQKDFSDFEQYFVLIEKYIENKKKGNE
jgi:uncharacterized protein YutE (UPF0331/DUF86 family)